VRRESEIDRLQVRDDHRMESGYLAGRQKRQKALMLDSPNDRPPSILTRNGIQ
jgi:hypothetical protein